MKRKDTTPAGLRRFAGPLAFALAAACFAAPAASASEPELRCGCKKSVEKHVRPYQDMKRFAEEAYAVRTNAAAKLEAAQRDWRELTTRRSRLEKLGDDFQELLKDCNRVKDSTGRTDLRDPKVCKRLSTTLESYKDRLEELSGRFRDLTSGENGWREAYDRGLSARTEFKSLDAQFQTAYDHADGILKNAYHHACVNELFENYLERDRREMRDLKKTIQEASGDLKEPEISGEPRKDQTYAQNAEGDIRTKETKIRDFPVEFADALHFEDAGVVDWDGLIAYVNELASTRAVVRFWNRGEPLEGLTQTLKEGETLKKPADPSWGDLEFFHWSDRNRGGGAAFEGFGQAVSGDLDLDAVYGFTVEVEGLDRVFPVPQRGQGRERFFRVFNDPEFDAYEKKVKEDLRREGRQFSGWFESGTQIRVGRDSEIARSCKIEPRGEDVFFRLKLCNANGQPYGDPVLVKFGTAVPAEIPLPPDESGFHYTHWSASLGGEEPWDGFGHPLDGDFTIYAVREAALVVRLHPEGGEVVEQGYRAGEAFHASGVRSDARAGMRFVDWTDGDGLPFEGRAVTANLDLYPRFRKETPWESIDRVGQPVEAKYPLPILVGADAALFVLMVVLMATGGKRGGGRRRKAEAAAGEKPAEESGGKAAESAPEGAPDDGGSQE